MAKSKKPQNGRKRATKTQGEIKEANPKTNESVQVELSPEIYAELLRRYNVARREHGKNGDRASIESPAHRDAIEYADAHNVPAIKWFLDAIVLARTGKAAEALQLLEDCRDRIPPKLSGQALHCAGIVLGLLGRFDDAINSYEKSLESNSSDSLGDTLFSLGFVYSRKEDFDRAIEYYEKALATPGFDNPGAALTNLGSVYSKKQDFDRAIEYYEKALATPGFENRHLTKVNLANNLGTKGRFEDATKYLNEVLSSPDDENQHGRAKRILRLVEAESAGIVTTIQDASIATQSNDSDSPESRMTQKLNQLEDKYTEYLKRTDSGGEDGLYVLRGWSSAVTLLEGTENVHWRGGGYFLKWRGKGIVIDPGFDFLDNFHDTGFHARELDAILVSHNHSDHNMDLQSLDDLRFQIYWRSLKKDEEGKSIPALPKCQIVLDEDTARAFVDQPVPHRDSPSRFTKADFQRERWHIADHLHLPMTVEHFPVEHGADVPAAIGMRLKLHQPNGSGLVLGYTGDTQYFDELVDQLQGCDVLLAHISQPDNREFEDTTFLKKKHLGYNGVTKLIEQLTPKPKLILIGEFWAGLADLRIELIQGLRKRTGLNNIMPTGLGFNLHLPSLQIECTECKTPTTHEQLRIVPPTIPFGPLGFVCGRCMV